jgi:hypothetical protein
MTVVFPEERLVELVQGERWFGAKAESLVGANVVDHAVLS